MTRTNQPRAIQELDFAQTVQARQAPNVTEFDGKVIDSAFDKLKILFPVGAPKAEQEAGIKAEWIKTLAAQRIDNLDLVQRGINRARCERDGKRLFWPSPLQFCHWCRASLDDMGLPSVRQAYDEAMRNYRDVERHKWSHPVVRLALRESGGKWLFASATADESFNVFERNYTMLIRRYAAGDEIDFNLPKALPETVYRPTGQQQSRENISNLREKFGLRSMKGANDA